MKQIVKKIVTSDETWLSLKAAAEYLNVHTATVRRWADAGQLPHMVTPGGHRRFALSAIRAFVSHPAGAQPPESWANAALSQVRTDMAAQEGTRWVSSISDTIRERHRQVGRRLMALTLQYLTAEDGTHLLDEAHTVGREYGEISKSSGITLSDALQAASFFRDKLFDASLDLPETTRPRNNDQRKLLKRINALLNTVQIAIAEVYEPPAPHNKHLPKTKKG